MIHYNGAAKINAIKVLRQVTGLGLFESKDCVEQGFSLESDQIAETDFVVMLNHKLERETAVGERPGAFTACNGSPHKISLRMWAQ